MTATFSGEGQKYAQTLLKHPISSENFIFFWEGFIHAGGGVQAVSPAPGGRLPLLSAGTHFTVSRRVEG